MDNLFLITSVINTSNAPLSYTNSRSIYSSKERFEQTKKTFESIKEKMPNTPIFCIECSELEQDELEYFQNNSTYFLNLYDNECVRQNIQSMSKSLGEGTMTFCAIEYILSNNLKFTNLIKISGRYWLSDNFNKDIFSKEDSIVIKYIDNNNDNVFTALYKLPKYSVINYYEFLKNNFDKMYNCIGYEILFANFIRNEKTEINSMNPIGLEGLVSVSNTFYNG